ncbi:MAG: hypothetical protein Ta2D_11920 [Rickettsiales bacterium]|nr:MAG: hypothetical protein Ta2D_11920 [Rickettsiales bacterium]
MKFKTNCKLETNPESNSSSNLPSNAEPNSASNPQPNSDCKLESKLKCKYCNSDAIKCNGNKYNKQRYYCNDCHKSFSLTDNRIKRDIKQRELCLLLYSHNMSMRSIQSTIQMFFNTKISFRLIEKWIKSFSKLLNYDISRQEKDKPRTIEIVELDELYSYYYDYKKKDENKSKYGLLLTETEIKLLHIK